jgi:type IV secretory pathway VirB3-like protein
MDTLVIDTAEVCQGAVRVRTLLGVPTELAIAVLCVGLGPVLMFWSWWLVPGLVALWLFLRFQAQRDPQFVQTWLSHLGLNPHYEA